jgi:hypothetical protein
MNLDSIKGEFKSRVCEQIDLEQEGEDRFLVATPFRFEDGDHYVIVLKKEGDRWILTDEASTLMHLSYWMDDKPLEPDAITNRKGIMDSSLSSYSVQNRDGELVIPITEARFGDALFNFIQALTKVSDLSFLSKERVLSTFMEDLMELIKEHVDNTRLAFNWRDEERDKKGNYIVDCRINSMKRPLFVFGVPNAAKAHLAALSLMKFANWDVPFQSLGVFEDQEELDPKPVARFTDAVDKSFSSLPGNKDAIRRYIDKALKVGQDG